MKAVILLLGGTALGAALVLACGNGNPGNADAATCDCPAAEPPLTGRIVKQGANTQSIAAGAFGNEEAGCPQGAVLLSGSCHLDPALNVPVYLIGSGFSIADPNNWSCDWQNTSAQAVTVTTQVVCLMPAQ